MLKLMKTGNCLELFAKYVTKVVHLEEKIQIAT